MRAITQEDINTLLADEYVVNKHQKKSPKNEKIVRGKYKNKIYKQGWVCNIIDHRRSEGCRKYSEIIDEAKKEIISALTYLT